MRGSLVNSLFAIGATISVGALWWFFVHSHEISGSQMEQLFSNSTQNSADVWLLTDEDQEFYYFKLNRVMTFGNYKVKKTYVDFDVSLRSRNVPTPIRDGELVFHK